MSDLQTQAQTIRASMSRLYHFYFAGLAPSTVHVPYLNGVDHSFATRGYGQEYGEALVSDNNGNLEVYVFYDLAYGRSFNFELPQTQTFNYQNAQINNKEIVTAQNVLTFELKSFDGSSYAQKMIERRDILNAGAGEDLNPTE